MKKKLNCILLVDDNPADNFIHSRVIKNAEITENIAVVENGQQALDYLLNSENIQPDLIFLDINMPIMDGWEFIDEYLKLGLSKEKQIIIAMLTTSFNPSDKERADKRPEILYFASKPLKTEILLEVARKNFPSIFSE
jgi:CheY-like chemotaxis protein